MAEEMLASCEGGAARVMWQETYDEDMVYVLDLRIERELALVELTQAMAARTEMDVLKADLPADKVRVCVRESVCV